MNKHGSTWAGLFSVPISSITGVGVVVFVGLSILGMMLFTYTDPSTFINNSPQLSRILRIATVNAELKIPVLPLPVAQSVKVPDKQIFVNLKEQTLTYTEDMTIMGSFKISSGLRYTPTPPGEYTVLKKKPVVDYVGPGYYYPRTKWNLMFKTGRPSNPLNYYIHGAYWHNNFGHPMSHGCVNVSYADMEGLYNWADEGTKIHIY